MASFKRLREGCTCSRGGSRAHSVTRIRVYYDRDAQGKQRTRSKTVHGSKRKARSVAAEMEQAGKSGRAPPARSPVFHDVFSRYLAEGIVSLRKRTRHDYKELIEKDLIPLIGRIRIDRFRVGDLYRLRSELLERLSPRQAFYAFQVLRIVLSYAETIELVETNIAKGFDFPRPEPRIRPKYDEDTVTMVLKSAHEVGIGRLVQVAVRTGLRPGEVMALKWEDMDLERRSAVVRRTLQRISGEGLVFGRTKSNRSRRINLDPTCVDILKDHHADQQERRRFLGDGYNDHDLVFCWEDGRPRDPATVSKTFRKALNKAGIPDIRMMDLRHVFSTFGLEDGEPVKAVQEQLGHASPATTWMFYADSIPGVQAAMVDRLGARFDRIGLHVVDRKLTSEAESE